MDERSGIITSRGNPLTLLGKEIKVGDQAPDFQVLDNDLKPVSLSTYSGKTILISSVTSLDTSVCDMETRRFNEEAGKLGDDVIILTISMDLPFAQKRWCGASGVDRVITLSDHREAEFGKNYGVLIKELRLLARAVFLLDKESVIRYVEIVPEVSSEPNYEAAIEAIKQNL
jgi:thiol peroxidase